MKKQVADCTIATQADGFQQSKNIVICSDGTGQRGGPGRTSNVWRTYLAVDPSPEGGPPQVRIHDDGVGTHNFIVFKWIGGAFGWGISRNLRRLYTELILTWNPGDKIFLFGFSRGAYTVRVLAQMICLFGIPSRVGKTRVEIERQALAALDSYKWANRESAKSETGYSETAASFKRQHAASSEAGPTADESLIHFIGCWDTVGAVGFPIESVTRAFTSVWRLKFRSNELNRLVRHARHALAIDDERRTFHPELWNESDLGAQQTVKQVWFPGMHSDVGGSYAKDELAHVSLLWMLQEASEQGLKFHDAIIEHFERVADASGKIHDSRSGLAAYYRYRPRRVEDLCQQMGVTPIVHAATLHRIFAQTESYAPKAITGDQFEIEESGTYQDNHLRPDPAPLERGFDYIWLNRGTYFLFLGLTILFVGLGWWLSRQPEPVVANSSSIRLIAGLFACFEVPLLKLAIAVLPGFAASILGGYLQCPGALTLILISLAGLLFVTRRLFELTNTAAEEAWADSRARLLNEQLPEDVQAGMKPRRMVRVYNGLKDFTNSLLSLLARGARCIRQNHLYRRFADFWDRRLIAAFVLILIGGLLGWGVKYKLAEGIRWVWAEAHRYELPTPHQLAERPSRKIEGPEVVRFDIDDPYHDTGLRVTEGATYHVVVKASVPWIDADPKDPEQKAKQLRGDPAKGLENPEDAPWHIRLAQNLLKRVQGQEIFIMIAAIGPDADTLIPIEGGNMKFEAPRSGRLFLFVNDVPGFYAGSNQGEAIVTIKPIGRDD